MTDKRSIEHKIKDLVLEEIENMTADQVRQKLQDVEKQYDDLKFDLCCKYKSISDCKTFEDVEEHVKNQFEMLKLEAMYSEYHFQLQFL